MASIDENLYSRQIAVYGKNAMKSLINSKVIIYAVDNFDGSILELCKNLILAGVGFINIITNTIVKIDDLSSNYYLSDSDIGKITGKVILPKLQELNPYVKVHLNDTNEIDYDVYILANEDIQSAIKMNKEIRDKNKNFIWLNTYGLMGNIFCDFNDFTSIDIDGENLSISVLQTITEDGTFVTLDTDPHGLYPNDIFIINDIKGIDINNKILTVSKVINATTFKVKEEYEWSTYISGGRILQQKKEINFNHNLLEEQIDNPSIINIDGDAYDLHDIFKNLHLGIEKENRFSNIFKETKDGIFAPVCSILGSYACQEVIKAITKKYTPTSQWFYYHCYDILPDNFVNSFKVLNDRYDGMRKIFGNELVDKIRQSSYFIVGSGAIGCEHLKNFSMIGLGSTDSKLYITDMDTIERSNLNRQFLFRNKHIGKIKSDIAAEQIKLINPTTNIIAHQNKVCKDTENIYDETFFQSLNGVANALDNVDARLYMDNRCISYCTPLFESGTLGTKGNVQVIIPRLMEHYSASQDQQEKTFPVCTVKNFPNSIDHTIHWARNEFEELFVSYPNSWNKYINDPDYIDSITNNEKGELINNILYLWNNRVNNFEDCIKFALNRFTEKYNNMIIQLLHSYPKDLVTNTGTNFWSGGKRCPNQIPFDKKNPDHFNYVYYCSYLIAILFNIDLNKIDIKMIIQREINSYKHDQFIPLKDVKISANEKEEKENSKLKYQNLDISLLPNIDDMKKYRITILDFEKDDDTNHHIDFITSSSNLRATNYDIPNIDRTETKIIAGKIIPAIATTTSIVSGLVTIEIIKHIFGKNKKEDYKNTFLNLALSIVAQSEPMPAIISEIKGKKLTVWDNYKLNGDIKINKLLEELKETYKIDIDTINYESKLLISPMTNAKKLAERKNMLLSELLKEFNIELNQKEYELQISSLMDEDDYELPNIKFTL